MNVGPPNRPSVRSCENVWAVLHETVHVKKDHPSWAAATRFHRRCVVDLEKAISERRPELRLVRPEGFNGKTVDFRIERLPGSEHPRRKGLIFNL